MTDKEKKELEAEENQQEEEVIDNYFDIDWEFNLN